MKTLKVSNFGGIEEYRLHEKPLTHPQEFVKDIIYANGVFSVTFSDSGDWFKSFSNCPCEYTESLEMENKSNRIKLQK